MEEEVELEMEEEENMGAPPSFSHKIFFFKIS